MVRALDFYLDRPGLNPIMGGDFFQLCFIPLLLLSCRKIRDINHSPKETVCIECESRFSGKNKKNISTLFSAELAERVVKKVMTGYQ